MKKTFIDVADIVAFAAEVKAAFEEKAVKAEINISLGDLIKYKRLFEDPKAAQREVERLTRKAIEEAMVKLAEAKRKAEKKAAEKKAKGEDASEYLRKMMAFTESSYASVILMPYRTALEMEVVPDGLWTRGEFNELFGLEISDKNWDRWVKGKENSAYTSQQTRHLEKAYAQFVIGF